MMGPLFKQTLLAMALLVAPVACSGTIIPGEGDTDGNGDDKNNGGELIPPECATMGPPMVRRLTVVQFRNSLEKLFSDPNVPSGAVLTDPVVHGFRVDATYSVIRDQTAWQLMTYAEEVANWAVDNKIGQISPCQNHEQSCWSQFIDSFGSKVYRQPVPAESIAMYEGMFASEPDFNTGAKVVVATMLQSPYFLYRQEIGEPDGSLNTLSPYELASNISYTLGDVPPDNQLMQAAADGRLTNQDDIDREVERLLNEPSTAESLGRFVQSWLEVDDLQTRAKDANIVPFETDLRRDMQGETSAFFTHILRSGGTYGDLMTANYTFANQNLSNFYQLAGGVGGNDFQQVELSNNRAPGILGHGSVLARHALSDSSSPVQRGKLIRERFLCETLAPPPPDVDASIDQPSGGIVTTRQRYEQHSQSETCKGCHVKLDPVGFAFENFDGFGRFRTQDNGQDVDPTGYVARPGDNDVPVQSIADIGSYLANEQESAECLASYLSYFAYGLEECSQESIQGELQASGGTVKSMLMGIVRAPHFSQRQPN